ncbi:NADP-dependent oxidoreductase [Nocardiopsis coralliicola]
MWAACARELNGIGAVEVCPTPAPGPGPGQALVRVRGAGAGPWDVGFLSGAMPGVAVPFIPGQEIAGVVEQAEDGAGVRAGDRVWGTLFPAGGGFAELAAADTARLAPLPRGTGFADAAGLVIAAGTAHEGLIARGGLTAGQSVLVTAASGGVGSAAVQIAAAQGARVFGAASPANHAYVRGLGAEAVFDYHGAHWAEQLREAVPDGVDLLFDAAGGDTRDRALGAVRDGGRAVSTIVRDPVPDAPRGIDSGAFSATVDRPRLEALSDLIAAGALRPQTSAAYPLTRAREALTHVATAHTRGKVVIDIAG